MPPFGRFGAGSPSPTEAEVQGPGNGTLGTPERQKSEEREGVKCCMFFGKFFLVLGAELF